jgi:hypothetical protein
MRLLSFATVVALLLFAGPETSAQKDGAGKSGTITHHLGKTLEQWIDLISGSDRGVSAMALEAVLAFPPEKAVKAVPVILKEMAKHNPPSAYLDASFRSLAPHTLAMVLTSQKKPDEKQIEDTLTLLKNLVKDGQIVIRKRAMGALMLFGPAASDAIPNLIAASKMNELPPTCWETRVAAVSALGVIGVDREKGPSRKILDALYLRYNDPVSTVRLTTVESLANIGAPYRKELKKEFIQKTVDFIAKEKEPHINLKARYRLYEASTEPKDKKRRRDNIAGYTASKEQLTVRIQALGYLMEIGQKESREVAEYLDKISGYAFSLKEEIPLRIESLRFMGSLAKHAVGYLGKVSDYAFAAKEEMPLRLESLRFMGSMGADAAKYLKPVADYAFSEKEEEPLRIESFRFLGAMGIAATDYLPKLIGVVNGKENADITGWAIWAVGAIAPPNPQWIQPLQKIVANKDEPESLRKGATAAIEHIFGKDKKDKKDAKDKKGGAKGAFAPPQGQWIQPLQTIAVDRDEPESLRRGARDAIDQILGLDETEKKNRKDSKGGAR